MKTFGIVLVVFAGLNLIGSLLALTQDAEAAGRLFSSAVMLGGIGAYLIHLGNKKKKKEEERKEWDK